MTVNGGFGLMVQVPEATIQNAAEAFADANPHSFFLDLNRVVDLTGYGISQTLLMTTQLATPIIRLFEPDTIEISLSVGAVARVQARLTALPGGPMPVQPPELDLSFAGSITVRVAGVFTVSAGRSYLSLDLRGLVVTSFTLGIGHSNAILTPRARDALSAIVRRVCVYILAAKVGAIPVSWTIGANIPILGPLNFPINFRYHIVAQGNNRALALLLQVFDKPFDVTAVRYALELPDDVGVFIDLGLIQYALDLLCQKLEGFVVNNPGGITGEIFIHDVHMHVEPGFFSLDEVKVQSRTLEQVTRTVEKILCTAIDPCHAICNKVFETVVEWVQLDQLAHAHGHFSPYVDHGRLRVNASQIDVDISVAMKALVFTSAQALIPLGGLVSIVLMIIGKVLADKMVENMVDEAAWDLVIDQPVPDTGRHAQATARNIIWPDGTFALMSTFRLV